MQSPRSTLAVLGAIGAIGLALVPRSARADDETRSFSIADQGVKITVPVAYEIANKPPFKHSPQDARCEIASADGAVHGTLVFNTDCGSPADTADAWEEAWKGRRADVKRVSDETPARPGTWLKREVSIVSGPEKRHYVLMLAGRGSRVAELNVWSVEMSWEAHKKEILAIADSLEWKRLWLCPACGKDAGADAAACPCGASLAAPDADL